MRKSNELQIGKAGEYLTCADLITKGLIAFPSEQGLPYDVLIDTGDKLLRCQVKTTERPRIVPQRSKESLAYIFNIKRHGKGNSKRYSESEVDVFALVELEARTVAYVEPSKLPETINIRIDSLKGSYYDEKGERDYLNVTEMSETGMSKRDISNNFDINYSTVCRMLADGYKPHKTKARYWSDFKREREWFDGI